MPGGVQISRHRSSSEVGDQTGDTNIPSLYPNPTTVPIGVLSIAVGSVGQTGIIN